MSFSYLGGGSSRSIIKRETQKKENLSFATLQEPLRVSVTYSGVDPAYKSSRRPRHRRHHCLSFSSILFFLSFYIFIPVSLLRKANLKVYFLLVPSCLSPRSPYDILARVNPYEIF